MPRIKSEQLQEGMIVASDVKNLDGMLLIPSGATLTERQINILQAWGVPEVEVQMPEGGDPGDPLARLAPEVVAELTADVQSRFWSPDATNPIEAEVMRLMLRRAAGRRCFP